MYLFSVAKILCATLLVVLLFSCQSKSDKSEVEKTQSTSNAVGLDSTLFSLSNNNFEAIFKRKSGNSSGYSKGPNLRQISGSLSMILSELYDNPIDLVNNPYSRHTYDLKITWKKGVPFENIRKHVSKQLQNELHFNIDSDLRQEQVFQIKIINESLFENSLDKVNVSEETTAKRTIKNNQWEFFGNLDGLAELLTVHTGRKILGAVNDNYKERLNYFQLNAVGGFSAIKTQLEDNYGIALNEELVSVDYNIITFEN